MAKSESQDRAFQRMKSMYLEEDSDEGLGVVFERDQETGLSYERMIYMRDLNHPREVQYDWANDKTNYIKHPIYQTRTGCNSCIKGLRKNDLN